MGGLEKNKHADKKLNAGRGAVGKTAVLGAKNRDQNKVKAKVIDNQNGIRFTGSLMKMSKRVQLSIRMTSRVTKNLMATNMELSVIASVSM